MCYLTTALFNAFLVLFIRVSLLDDIFLDLVIFQSFRLAAFFLGVTPLPYHLVLGYNCIETVQSQRHILADEMLTLGLREFSFIGFNTFEDGVPVAQLFVAINCLGNHFAFTVKNCCPGILAKVVVSLSCLRIEAYLLEDSSRFLEVLRCEETLSSLFLEVNLNELNGSLLEKTCSSGMQNCDFLF